MARAKKQNQAGADGPALHPPGLREHPPAPPPGWLAQNRYSKRTAARRRLTGEDAGWHEFSGAGAHAARPGQPDE